jgi:thymidylate synthase (FAD)
MADYVAKGQDFPVLDHGYIKIIDWMGKDETIIEAARMSTGKGFQGWKPGMRCKNCGWMEGDLPATVTCDGTTPHDIVKTSGDMNLLDYLWRNGHSTPFEMCELHIEVNAPVLVWRQWMRHRTFSYNEASARYAPMSSDHYMPNVDRFRPKQSSNKQEASVSWHNPGSEDWDNLQKILAGEQKTVYEQYEEMLSIGVPAEVARLNSPVSRYSKARVKTDLKNWLGFLRLRMHPHAQWEIRMYAEVVGKEIIAKLWPRSWEVFCEHTLYGTHLSRTEMSALKLLLTTRWNAHEACKSVGLEDKKKEEFLRKLEKGGTEIL